MELDSDFLTVLVDVLIYFLAFLESTGDVDSLRNNESLELFAVEHLDIF